MDPTVLQDELNRLCKNRAMRSTDLQSRLGPQAREAFDLGPNDSVALLRQKMAARIKRLLPNDPDEFPRTVALAALALHPSADRRLLSDRENWLAERYTWHPRTVRRRVKSAMRLLVDALTDADHARHQPRIPYDDGFVVQRFQATMRLDGPVPVLEEFRRIRVTADRLDAIMIQFTVPRSSPDIEENDVTVRARSGGQITTTERRSPEHFAFRFEPTRVLLLGDEHEYGLEYTLPAGQAMRPHYVFQPLVPCERFEVTVRFDPLDLPADIWLVDGVAPRELDARPVAPRRLDPDATGAVRRTFDDLRQGLAYGVRWTR